VVIRQSLPTSVHEAQYDGLVKPHANYCVDILKAKVARFIFFKKAKPSVKKG